MRPMLLKALRRDLEDLGIVVELEERPSSARDEPESSRVDDAVIDLILSHCPSATRSQVLDAMRINGNNVGLTINMLHDKM